MYAKLSSCQSYMFGLTEFDVSQGMEVSKLFQGALRAFKFLSHENYLPTIAPTCHHKVDSLVLTLAGFSEIESEHLMAELQFSNIKEFELGKLKNLKPESIKRIAGGSLSHALILWALLKRFIEYHSKKCNSMNAQSRDYVVLDEKQSLRRDIPISEVGLSARSLNSLLREGIHSIFQLSQIPKSELFQLQSLGTKSVNEIVSLLEKMGFYEKQEFVRTPSTILTSAVALENLNLSNRTFNILRRKGIKNLVELSELSDTDLSDMRNFGEKSKNEVKELIARHALAENSSEIKIQKSVEVHSEDLYLWAKSEIKDELDRLGKDLIDFGHLKLNYQMMINSNIDEADYDLYLDCGTLLEVQEKLLKQFKSVTNVSSIEDFILNLNSFILDFLAYKDYCQNFTPSKGQKESLLKYENDYSDNSVDLLKFDNYTWQLLGLSSNDVSVYLGEETYFELLDSVLEYFILDKNVWHIIRRVVIFHQKYQTYPNILGLIIAYCLGSQITKEAVLKELTFLFESSDSKSATRNIRILQMRMDGSTLAEIGKAFRLTKERVRQILFQISPDLNSTIEVLNLNLKQTQDEIINNKFEEIINKYGAIYKSELAKELGVDEEHAIRVTPSKFNKYIIDKFPESVFNLTWSKEDCLEALRKAGTYYFPLRQADYDHLISIGEVKGPSVAYMYLKLGKWSELCSEAGVESVAAVRSEYARTWSEEELLSFARRYFKEPETSGTYGGYDSWRERQSDHVPSGVLIRNVFGGWTTVKRKALEGLRQERGLEVRSGI